jgi:hypothetical protein
VDVPDGAVVHLDALILVIARILVGAEGLEVNRAFVAMED